MPARLRTSLPYEAWRAATLCEQVAHEMINAVLLRVLGSVATRERHLWWQDPVTPCPDSSVRACPPRTRPALSRHWAVPGKAFFGST